MAEDIFAFWDEMARVQMLDPQVERAEVTAAFLRLEELCIAGDSHRQDTRADLVAQLKATMLGEGATALEAAPIGEITEVPAISADAAPGISLVTCSMNRSENLVKALRSWLQFDEISEIVLVDWGSDIPVAATLRQEGISDPRIRLVRAEDEPRWILSYAFNLGFRMARFDKILKADADIVLGEGFFAHNPLTEAHFIAGNWREAEEGQEHVNGFFYLHKRALAEVGGFNEYITTYGWDDDDLYTRLSDKGLMRQNVAQGTIQHLDHSDVTRSEDIQVNDAAASAIDELRNSTMYKIRRNRFIANVMPVWEGHAGCIQLPVTQQDMSDGSISVRRIGWLGAVVPAHVEADASFYAASELVSWEKGQRLLGLDAARLEILLSKPMAAIDKLDVELARSNRPDVAGEMARYLVLNVNDDDLLVGETPGSDALCNLVTYLRQQGWLPVLRCAQANAPEGLRAELVSCPFIPIWEDIGLLEGIALPELRSGAIPAVGQHRSLSVARTVLLENVELSTPMISVPRRKLFIDAQHGLGNRLRAIGSGAAVAEKTDRELVIVWEPDSHCEGRLSDLYDYQGAVEDVAFYKEAETRNCLLYNYMEVEEGSEKDAPIVLDDGKDLYARAAYVLNSPHSSWEEENRFLQNLTPIEPIRALVEGVRTPNNVSAHVRMVGGSNYEHLAYEALDNWTEEGHAETEKWRKRSHFSHFLKRIDVLIKEGRADRIFLAADKPETYEAFLECYGDRVAYLPRELYDRSAEQLHYALADAMLLGSSPLLLGSTWSSFSELAMRLSPQKMTIEMSGKDF